jgi:hypothetical protein
MDDGKKTFTQAIILALIPTIAGILSAYFANSASNAVSSVEERLVITQLRLDENALIGTNGFHLPIGDDGMWRDYYSCRTDSAVKNDRVTCSINVKETSQQSTHPDVAKPAKLY